MTTNSHPTLTPDLNEEPVDFPVPAPLSGHGPARVIAMCNQKGGVGKTTFADEIAWGLERRGREVGFINLDPQGGASHEQKTVEGEKAVTVVDTPGYLNDKLGGCVEVADIAIVPVEPSQRGLRAMKRTIQLITGVNPELEIGLIVNRYSDKRIIDRSFTDFLTADDLPILGCVPTGAAGRPRGGRDRGDSGQGGGDAVMARTKKADSAINSFFTDTSKEMVERQETIVEKVVNPDSEPAAEKKAAASEGPTHRLSVIVPDDLYWQLKEYLVEHRREGYRSASDLMRSLLEEHLRKDR